jgi:hypothetical protein
MGQKSFESSWAEKKAWRVARDFLFLVSVGSTFTLAVRFRAASFFGVFFVGKKLAQSLA